MDIDAAITLLLDPVREGGYSDGRGDPGGETNYGVTIAVARRHGYAGPMRDIPLDVVRAIYRSDYWGPAGCDAVPDGARFDLFDIAVNAGAGQAIKLLQRAVGAAEDGQLGPMTLQAINSMPAWRVAARLEAHAQIFRTGLANWPAASRGWTRRQAANLLRL